MAQRKPENNRCRNLAIRQIGLTISFSRLHQGRRRKSSKLSRRRQSAGPIWPFSGQNFSPTHFLATHRQQVLGQLFCEPNREGEAPAEPCGEVDSCPLARLGRSLALPCVFALKKTTRFTSATVPNKIEDRESTSGANRVRPDCRSVLWRVVVDRWPT